MIRYLARRFLRGLLLVFAVSFTSFVLFELAPGDFLSEARLNTQLSEETIVALRSRYGLDRPLLAKYSYWLGSVFRSEWGYSFAHNTPVSQLLWGRARNTLLLTVTAAFLAWAIAMPITIWAVTSRKRVRQSLVRGGVSLVLAVPDLLIVLLLLLAASRAGFLPLGGMVSLEFAEMSFWSRVRDVAAHLALPVTALVLSALPMLVTHALSAITELLDSPFIRAAHAHGIPRRRLLYRHVLPAAANPLISLFGISAGTLLSSSLLVESVMGWPGLGRLLLDSIFQRDVYVVIGVVVLSAVFLVTGNLVADLLLYATDPRIRRDKA